MDSQRALLASLMSGILPDAPRLPYSHPDVCKHHLVAFCPYTLFTNTKAAIGTCGFKVHDDALAEEYRAAGSPHPEYQEAFFSLIEGLVLENDRLVERSKAKVQLEQSIFDRQRHASRQRERELQRRAGAMDPRAFDALVERIVVLEATVPDMERNGFLCEIKGALTLEACTHDCAMTLVQYRRIPELGKQGELAQALGLLVQADVAQFERDQLCHRRDSLQRQQHLAEVQDEIIPTGTAINTVCDVCGGILGNETTVWLDSHMSGKQHLGFRRVRDAYEEFLKKGFAPKRRGSGYTPRPPLPEAARGGEARRDSHSTADRVGERDYPPPRTSHGSYPGRAGPRGGGERESSSRYGGDRDRGRGGDYHGGDRSSSYRRRY